MENVKQVREVQSNLAIITGFTAAELALRAERHREQFEEACRKQGYYLPNDTELVRWFTV